MSMERFSKLLILLNQPAAWSSCCKAGRQSSVLVLTRVLVLVLVTSRLELVTCSRSSRLMLVTSRIDLLHQVFTSSCIFTLLSLLHQPTIVLLYSRLKISHQINRSTKLLQGSSEGPALQAFEPGPHPDPC